MGGKVNLQAKYVEPTIILEPKEDSALMKDEIFGPIMPVYPFDKLNDAIDFINDREKPLAVYYFGDKNSARCQKVCDETSSGAFVTNE